MRVYVASSWRNDIQPVVVEALREIGHHVYDFKNPGDGMGGFSWASIDPDWQAWTPRMQARALQHPHAVQGLGRDHLAMNWAEALVLVQPCGASAHLELGWAISRGIPALVLLESGTEPELMYGLATACCATLFELIDWFGKAGPITFALELKRWRIENRLPAAKAAHKVGVTYIRYLQLEGPTDEEPTIDEFDRIGRVIYGPES